MFEYVNSGIPIVVSDIKRMKKFVEINGVGNQIDWKDDIYTQIKEISKINVEEGFLKKRGMIFEDRIPGLTSFYNNCRKGRII